MDVAQQPELTIFGAPGDRSVLIVDGLEARRHHNSDLLKRARFTVFSAPTADTALRMLQKLCPGLALLSDSVEPLGGVDLCTALRHQPDGAALPIIVLTGSDDPASRASAYEAGADDVIACSVPDEELVLRVERLSDRRRRSEQLTEQEKLAAVFRVAHTIRHGINNPLQVMGFGLEMLRDKLQSDEEAVELLGTLTGNLGRIRQLVDRLSFLTELKPDPRLNDPDLLDVFDPEAPHVKRLRERGGYRVLVVEDDAGQRLLATSVLARSGRFLAQEAASGVEALEMARRDPPDVILTDLNMPGLSGFDLLAQIKGDPRLAHTVILVLTVRQSLRDLMRCHQLGATNYLLKPIDPGQLVEQIFRTMGHRGYASISRS